MTSPMPHRRSRGRSGGHTIRPALPPAPPRWTTLDHEASIVPGWLQIVIISDIPNLLTLAWTHTKPGIHERNIVRLGTARAHHNTYTLKDVNLVPEAGSVDTTTHYFFLPIEQGCHNYYYSAFDGPDPFSYNSISPIFAFTICAQGYGVLGAAFWDSGGSYGAALKDDLILGFSVNQPGFADVTLTSPDCDLIAITGQQDLIATFYDNVFPYGPIGTDTSSVRPYCAHVKNDNPAFNRFWGGTLVRGAQWPLSGGALASATGSSSFTPPGPTCSFSMTEDCNCPSGQYTTLIGDNFGAVDSPTWTPFDPFSPVAIYPGPINSFSGNGTRTFADGSYVVSSMNCKPAPVIASITDITRHWRTLPGVPE